MSLFEGLNLDNLSESKKELIKGVDGVLKSGFDEIGQGSQVIYEAGKTTIEQGRTAVEQMIAGDLDAEGAQGIFRRGMEQLEDLAKAEGQLIIAGSLAMLKKIGNLGIGWVGKALGL